MKRRDILKYTLATGALAAAQTARADLIVPNRRRRERDAQNLEQPESHESPVDYIVLETFYAANQDKRDALAKKFDELLIPQRRKAGFKTVGVLTINDELMRDEKGYDANRFDVAVFVAQNASSADLVLNFQDVCAGISTLFNTEDDLDFIDEEIVALRSFPSVPSISKPYNNEGRVIQLRTYNSPNYDRNIAKQAMFEEGELKLFRDSGMEPVFFGRALFGSMAPNVTYMLSFKDDEARREGWKTFVNSEGWKKLSADPKYARTATRIRNLFLKPTPNSEI